MRRIAYLAIAISNLLFFSHVLPAQQPVYSNLTDWQQISSEHFDILYLPPNQSLARKAARYAEIALVEVGLAYDYKPQSRYSLYLLSDILQLPLSHTSLDQATSEAGFFQLDAQKKYLSYPGDSKSFYTAVKKEVADILLQEFTYGKRLRELIQGQNILKQSLWYQQGMVEYVGHGWTYQDEMWLHSLSIDNIDQILDMTLEGKGFINEKLRKSVWHYITHEYGEQKVAEIIYFVNISNSIDAGIISVLGITLNTLTGRWRENLREIATRNAKGRYGIAKMTAKAPFPLKKGYRLLQFSFSPLSQQYAVFLDKGGLHELYIYDLVAGQYSKKILTSSFANPLVAGQEVTYPLSWSKDGKQLFTTRYDGKSYQMAWYQEESSQVIFQPVPERISRILHADWSHRGNRLVVSALTGSSPQIFTLSAQGSDFEAITSDYFDNVDPSWSFDDEYILFSSNRDTIALQPKGQLQDTRLLNFDIFKYPFSPKTDTLTQLTHTNLINERFPQAPNSFEVVYLTDETGIPNLKKVNIFLKQENYLTDLAPGILRYQILEDQLIFSTTRAAQAALFRVLIDSLPSVTIPELSLFRTETLLAYRKRQKEIAEIKRLEKLVAEQDANKNTFTEEENAADLQTDPAAEKEVEKPTEGAETKEKKVRYYIFDDYEEPYEVKKAEKDIFDKKEKQKKQRQQKILLAKSKTSLPEYANIQLQKSVGAENPWEVSHLSLQLGRRPDAGAYARLGAKISDKLHNHEVEAFATPFVDFRNFNGSNGRFELNYNYLKGRIDYFLQTDLFVRHYRRINTLFPLDSAIFRYDRLSVTAGLRYPLSSYSELQLDGSFFALDRRDQKLLNQTLADQRERVVRLGASYRFDKTTAHQGFRYKGWKGEAAFKTYYSTVEGSSLFSTASIQINKYTRIKKRFVLASQFQGGYSFGNRRQQFYLGGVQDWIPPFILFSENDSRLSRENAISTDLLDFSFQEFVTPMRGFWFFTRRGSRYFALTNELRIPLSRISRASLNSGPLYSFELIPFVDVGSVWASGNPFSSTNPTDTRLVGTEPVIVVLRTLRSPFVVGVGSGIRTNFFGYSLRVDLGWGIEDAAVEKVSVSLALGRNF